MKKYKIKPCIVEFRELKNHYSLNSVGSFIHVFYPQERFLKLLNPKFWSILHENSKMIKSFLLFFLMAIIIIARVKKRNMVFRKDLYFMGLFPTLMTSFRPIKDPFGESFRSYNRDKFIVLNGQRANRILDSCVFNTQENTWFLPINKKSIIPELNKGHRWWRYWFSETMGYSPCFHGIITVIEISFKKYESKCLTFLSNTDGLIRKEHNRVLVNRRFLIKVRNNILSNIQSEFIRSSLVQSIHSRREFSYYDQSREILDILRNKDLVLGYRTLINRVEIQKFKERLNPIDYRLSQYHPYASFLFMKIWDQQNSCLLLEAIKVFIGNIKRSICPLIHEHTSEIHLTFHPFCRDKDKKHFCSFAPYRQVEIKEMAYILKILMHSILVHSSMVSLHNQTSFDLSRRRNGVSYQASMKSQNRFKRFQEIVGLITLSITESNQLYSKIFFFITYSYVWKNHEDLLNKVWVCNFKECFLDRFNRIRHQSQRSTCFIDKRRNPFLIAKAKAVFYQSQIYIYLFQLIEKVSLYPHSSVNIKRIGEKLFSSLFNKLEKSVENHYSMISQDIDNLLTREESLNMISSIFDKFNQFRVINYQHTLWFYFNKVSYNYVEKYRINNQDLITYGQEFYIFKKRFLEREDISLIEPPVFSIFVSDHSPSKLIRKVICSPVNLIKNPMSEEQMPNWKNTSFHKISNMNLFESEVLELHNYRSVKANPCYGKNLRLTKEKRCFLFLKKCIERGRIQRYFQKNSYSTYWNIFNRDLLRTYIPWFLTLMGCKHLKFTLFETLRNSLMLLHGIQKSMSILLDMMNGSHISWILTKMVMISEISRRFVWNILLYERSIHQKHELPVPLIWELLRPTKAQSLKYSLFLLIVVAAGYLVHIPIQFVFRTSTELQTEFEEMKYFMIPSYSTDFRKLMDRYPPYELDSFWLKNIFRISLEQLKTILVKIRDYTSGAKSMHFAFQMDLVSVVSIRQNPIDQIRFLINTRHINSKSKKIHSWIIKRKNIRNYWIDDKIEFWVENSDFVDDNEREFLVQFSVLTIRREFSKLFLSMTHSSDLLSKNSSGYQRIEKSGSICLRYLVEIHQQSLMNYEFNGSCLAERRIFLALYKMIAYSQALFEFKNPRGKPFSMRSALYPSIGVLVIGPLGTGRTCLIKYLSTRSRVPLITVFSSRFLYETSQFMDEYSDIDDSLGIELLNMYIPTRADQFDITLQLELAKTMAPCMIWIPNIQELQAEESIFFSLGLSDHFEIRLEKNIFFIASTHIPQKIDPILIAPNKFDTLIKIRRLTLTQQRKHVFILSYTRGFFLEKKICHQDEFESITKSINARDVRAFINGSLSISIMQNKSLIGTNTIFLALHRKAWAFRSQIRSVQYKGILLYQIGRVITQNVFLCNYSIEPIFIYIRSKSFNRVQYLYQWYFELGTIITKLMMLIYILSCSSGLVAQDLLSSHDDNINSYRFFEEFIENDPDMVIGILLLLEVVVAGNTMDRAVSFRKEGEDEYEFRSIFSKTEGFKYEFDEIGRSLESQGDFFNNTVWAFRFTSCKKLVFPQKYNEDVLELSKSETVQHRIYLRAGGFFRARQLSRYPTEYPVFYFKREQHFLSVLSRQKDFINDNISKVGLIDSKEKTPFDIYQRWFVKKVQKKHLTFFRDRQIWLRTKSSLHNVDIHLSAIYESYQYLSTMFRSNHILMDQITKALMRKRWIFPDEVRSFIHVTGIKLSREDLCPER
uniref:Ycf2 protein n=1 Tax=Didymoplexis pallens TaxID=2848458 RepID=A0A976UFI4_9ASPA|nr:Ycf2 protein [Didymoplexis pallens]YP_010471665.1 Ycf2 protein [Didymoplexis pallens]UVG41017.1 Ycf2 protein [Didymoplexis pallens]UVG41022.1 Ycf2 protein [Didymoplexis pallens]